MKAEITDASFLSAIPPKSLHFYLIAQGWEKADTWGERGDVYVFGERANVLVPVSSDFADYAPSVGRILSIIATVEERSELSVYRDLSVADVDLIRVRAPEADDDGSISIEAGVLFFQQAREVLLAAACSATKPQRAYRAGKIKEAQEYMDGVRIGQTERGSFVLTMLSPVPPMLTRQAQADFWPEMAVEPFARQVTRRLSHALAATKEAVSLVNRGETIDAFESRVSEGVSANLCEATAKLIAKGNGLDISLTWAVTRPAPQKRVEYSFSKSDASTLSEAAKQLRDKEPRPGERIVGFVTALARDESAVEGRITVKAPLDDKLSSVRVDLDRTVYDLAIKAHKEWLPIALVGDLEREGQRWRLANPREIEVLPVDTDEKIDRE